VTNNEINRSHPPSDEGQKPKGFQRRFYRGWKPFWHDLKHMISNREKIKAAMGSNLITEPFRERLMMAVTEVNQCSYCRRFHVGQAQKAGISTEEITQYLKGTIPEDIPEDQKLAICYAQHWAETDAQPDGEIQDQVIQAYGQRGFEEISMVLRMIRMGNLLGNTLDYLLYRISFGRLGV
jgi:AhpD family alkylhydroperoxidase